ncbi:fused MFS/spermidine synthase [Candidatus Sumerlaeota bacterium]|nr:fused MFS/spermidine synthase [Candidatus Sumerlaeota bacterium]
MTRSQSHPADRIRRLILLCFFLSGIAGLIYEIIWTRLLALVMGATVYSLSTVLVAFMAGLGLGAWLISGPMRRHPEWSRLRLYGTFEIIIGLWCLGLPWLMRAVEPLFAVIYNRLYGSDPGALFTYSLAQFAICAPLMLVPTTLMGATLPLLADHVARRPGEVGRGVGLVYGINTVGAMVGAVTAGYLLIPLLGFTGTNLFAVGGNFVAGGLALWLARREGRGEEIESAPTETVDLPLTESPSRGVAAVVFAIFALSGLASMSYQIGWTRVISLIIDSTTYSFTIIVTCFILGLGLGSLLLSRMVDREPRPVMLLGLVQALIGMTAMVTLPILGLLSVWVFFLMIAHHDQWWLMQLIIFVMVLGLLILPTLLMGATFPLVARILAPRGGVGPVVGHAYAFNALGTIAGTFIAGFILIPHPAIGTERTLILATALNVALGIVAVFASPELRLSRRAALGMGLGALWVAGFFVCVPINNDGERGWDKDIITSSPLFYYEQFFAGSLQHEMDFKGYLDSLGPRVDYREGPFSTVVIRRGLRGHGRSFMIYTGGRPEASDADAMQNVLIHLGMMIHPDPRRVCVIGLGSGSTARAATTHPDLEHLDVIEISRAVRDLSAKYFPEIHADLERAGANIIVADGRNHLALTDQVYDVIVSQPSHPHLTGVASLYTRDFFQICRDRLAPGGICVIWNFAWRIEPEMFRAYMRSFEDVFEGSCIFVLGQGSYTFMIGFNADRPEIDWEVVARHLAECTDPKIVDDTHISDMTQLLVWPTAREFIDILTLGPRGVARFAGEGPLNTDDNALLEYALPRSYDVDRTSDIRRRCVLVGDLLEPHPGEAYDPPRHELIWEYITHAPPALVPESMRR